MATMTIRVPDAKHERLKNLAEKQGLSLNKLFEEWSNIALAQSDAEAVHRTGGEGQPGGWPEAAGETRCCIRGASGKTEKTLGCYGLDANG